MNLDMNETIEEEYQINVVTFSFAAELLNETHNYFMSPIHSNNNNYFHYKHGFKNEMKCLFT